ncbi:hypothetical protein BRADI_3g34110v3 [Brachypodium distachyon]|uniref:RRM domain-containing protein n=1 Tax=Brachypodium distachyon TaxID=15368 RepID=A0A2K2D0Z0_BRADI|nr:hypothetical protein BRADI_3g34110v3 [Brachypodium distachyon]
MDSNGNSDDRSLNPDAGDIVLGIGSSRSRIIDQEIEEMQRKLRELGEEIDLAIVSLNEQIEMTTDQISGVSAEEEDPAVAIARHKSEVDSRSIYVGNVDYACLPEQIQAHFQDCGAINRVTILIDDFGDPKGYAYVEFAEVEAVEKALLMNDTKLLNRPMKVSPKRTNVPGRTHPWGRRPFQPYPTYGKFPRFRRPQGYSPYY